MRFNLNRQYGQCPQRGRSSELRRSHERPLNSWFRIDSRHALWSTNCATAHYARSLIRSVRDDSGQRGHPAAGSSNSHGDNSDWRMSGLPNWFTGGHLFSSRPVLRHFFLPHRNPMLFGYEGEAVPQLRECLLSKGLSFIINSNGFGGLWSCDFSLWRLHIYFWYHKTPIFYLLLFYYC